MNRNPEEVFSEVCSLSRHVLGQVQRLQGELEEGMHEPIDRLEASLPEVVPTELAEELRERMTTIVSLYADVEARTNELCRSVEGLSGVFRESRERVQALLAEVESRIA